MSDATSRILEDWQIEAACPPTAIAGLIDVLLSRFKGDVFRAAGETARVAIERDADVVTIRGYVIPEIRA